VSRRGPGRLSPLKLRQLAKSEGLHADGGCLYLQVTRNKKHGHLRASWIFSYTRNGRTRSMGLGPLHTVSLALAREKALTCRQQLLEGVDPIEARKARQQAAALESVKAKSFDEVRDAYLNEHRGGWRSVEYASDWLSSMKRYVTPVFGRLAVKDVDLALVIKALEAIWNKKPETAGRVRSRIEAVLDFASVNGWRTGDNPARWDLLSKRFPARSRLAPVKHHAAMKFDEVPAFVAELRQRSEPAAAAVEFVVLTASRRGEVLGARWGEFDLGGRVWEVPAERMKSHRPHRVPLSDAAVAVLERQRAVRQSEYVFPGTSRPCVSAGAVDKLFKRLGRTGATLHGFRSSFRDWVAERTTYSSDVAEAALAHKIVDATRAAYERGDKFRKRAVMMQAWADFLAGIEPRAADVTPIRAVS
jgi:integrase